MMQIKKLIAFERTRLDHSNLLKTLDNPSIPLKNRLIFLPSIAYFVMSFGDLNKYILPFQSPKNSWENIVNIHTAEDAEHWIWFIQDLEKLNYALPESFIETLKQLWAKENNENQILFFKLIDLIHNQPANIRLAIIEAIEVTGNIIFSKLRDITHNSEYQLSYCSDIHVNKETGHTIGQDENMINQITFTEAEREIAIQSVKRVFKAFVRWYEYLDKLIVTQYNQDYPLDY